MASRLAIGDTVHIHYPAQDLHPGSLASAFHGHAGVVIGEEPDGKTRMYRVKLDVPVPIEGMEPVTDDLWARNYLRKSRRAVRRDDDVEMCECGHAADDHDRRGDNACPFCPCGNEVVS